MTQTSVEQLGTFPELAIIAVLEAAADIAVLALAAVYPEIGNLEDHADDFELRSALAVIAAARTLVVVINRYRLALHLAAQERDDLLPF